MSGDRAVEDRATPVDDVAGPAAVDSPRHTPGAALALQHTVGNRAAGALLAPTPSTNGRDVPIDDEIEHQIHEALDHGLTDEVDTEIESADGTEVERESHDRTMAAERATATTGPVVVPDSSSGPSAVPAEPTSVEGTPDQGPAAPEPTAPAAGPEELTPPDSDVDVGADVDAGVDAAVGAADATTTTPRDAVAVLANPPPPPPPLSDLPPDPAVAEYRGQAQEAATSIEEPDTAAVTGPAADADAAAAAVDEDRRAERPDFDDEAEGALPEQPEPDDPRDAIPADPVPEASELMTRHSTVRLDPQTLPDPVRSPNVDDEQYDVHVAGVMPGQPVAAPPAETAEADTGPSTPAGSAGGPDRAMQEAVDGADQPRAEDDRETEPSQPTVLTDDGPQPDVEPAAAVPPEIMVDVVAAAVAAAGRTAQGWARSAESRAFPNDVLHQVAPQIAETALPRLTSDYVGELEGVAEAAGVAHDALGSRVELFQAQIEASTTEASDELAAADEATRAAIAERVETDEAAVTGAAEKNQEKIDRIREHAHLDPDEAAVVDKGLELIQGVRAQALEIRGQRRAATDRRRQQLREARQRLAEQYEQTSTAQARAIAGWYRRATPEPVEGQSQDDVVEARDRAAAAAAGPTVRWASRQTAALGRQFTELGRELDRVVREQEAELDEAEQSALTMIRDWQQDELDERRTWFEQLWHALTDWTTDATGATAEWESATRQRLAQDAQSDLATLGTILEGGITDVRARRDEIAAGLDDAQRAVLDAFLRPGGTVVSALSAGLVTRIMQRRVPELVDQFKAKAQELDELEPLVAIGRAQSSSFDAMGRAGRVHQAVDGMGTNEDRLFEALNGLTPIQVKAVRAAYAYLYPGSDMRADIEDDLDGVFDGDELGDRADALLSGNQMLADVAELRNAVEEWGIDEGAVYRLLRNRTPEERREIERLYQETYHESLSTRLDDEMDGLELERAEALLAGDQQAADAIGLRDSLEGWSGGVFSGDAAGVEGVFTQIRADVEQRARAEGWTTEEMQAEIVRRNREVQAAYDAGTGLEAGMADGRSLDDAMANDIGTRDASVAFAMLRGDREGEDVARIRREVEAEFDTDDDVILEVLADQRRRARAETALDLNADLETRRVVENWSAARTARERRDVRAEIERQATERTEEQFESLSNRYDRESRHSLLPSGRLAHDLQDVMGGDDPEEAAAYIAQGGVLSEAQELYFAMQGAGTDDERVHRVLQDPANPGRLRSPEEMQRIRSDYAALAENEDGESLDDAIDGDFDGSDLRDVQYELMGQGTDAEMARRLSERNNREDEGILWDGPSLAQLIMYDDYRARNRATGFAVRQARALEEMHQEGDPKNDDDLAIQTGEVQDQLAELRSQRATADPDTQAIIDQQLAELTERRSHLADLARARGMFDTGMTGANELITINREQVDSITDDVANGVAAVAAMAVAIVLAPETGGGSLAAGTAAWAALMGSAAGTAAGLGTRMLIGRQVTPEMLGEQLAMGGVDAAVTLLTLGLGTGLARATLSDGVTLAGRGLADAISQSNRLMRLVARSRMPAPIQRAILFEAGYIVETTVSTAVTTGAQMFDADVLRQPDLANVFWDRFGEGLVQGLTVEQARSLAMSHVENHLSDRHRAAVRRRDERRAAVRDAGSAASTDTTSTETTSPPRTTSDSTGDGVERVGRQLDSGASDAQQHSSAEFDAATAAADALARSQLDASPPQSTAPAPAVDTGGSGGGHGDVTDAASAAGDGEGPMFTQADIDAAVARIDESAVARPLVQIESAVYTGDGSSEGQARIDVDGLDSIRVDDGSPAGAPLPRQVPMPVTDPSSPLQIGSLGPPIGAGGDMGSVASTDGGGVMPSTLDGREVVVKVYGTTTNPVSGHAEPSRTRTQIEQEVAALHAMARTGYGPLVHGIAEVRPGVYGIVMDPQPGAPTRHEPTDTPSSTDEAARQQTEVDTHAGAITEDTIAQVDDFGDRLLAEGFVYGGEFETLVGPDGRLRPIDAQGIEPLSSDPERRRAQLENHHRVLAEARSDLAADRARVSGEPARPAFGGDEIDAAFDAIRTDSGPHDAAPPQTPPIVPLADATAVHFDQPDAPSGPMPLDQPPGVPVSPHDAAHSFGMPEPVQQEFARFARDGGALLGTDRTLRIDVRPTNVDSLDMLRSGEGSPKPEAIKAKTINDLDVRFLGAPPDARGQVGFFGDLPETLGPAPPPDVSAATWAAAEERLQQRRQEHADHAARMAQMALPLGHPGREGLPAYAADVQIRVDERGVVHQIGTDGAARPIVGDHDVFLITWEDGTPLTQQQHDIIVAAMRSRGMNVEHGMHMEWRPGEGGEGAYRSIITEHATGDEALLRINADGTMETARAGEVPDVDDRGLMPGGTYVGDLGHQVPSPRRVPVVDRRSGRVREATWRQTVGGYDESVPSAPWSEPQSGVPPTMPERSTSIGTALPEAVEPQIGVPDAVRARFDELHGDGGSTPSHVREDEAAAPPGARSSDAATDGPAGGDSDGRPTVPVPAPDETAQPGVGIPEDTRPEILVPDEVRRRFDEVRSGEDRSEARPTQRPAHTAPAPGPNAAGSETIPQLPPSTESHIPGVQEQLTRMFDDGGVQLGGRMPERERYRTFDRLDDFEAAVLQRDPDRPPKLLHLPFFDRATGEIFLPPYCPPTSVAHETLHALTHEAFGTRVPDWIEEGVTEMFTIDAMGGGGDNDYGDNVELAQLLRDAVGDDVLRRAYFDGDIDGLDAALAANTMIDGGADQLRGLFEAFRVTGTTPIDPDLESMLRTMLTGRARSGGIE